MGNVDMETPGGRIHHLRKDILHLTMDQFAEPLGVRKAAISKVEKGQTNLSTQLLRSICREYNVREEWLKDGIGDPIGNQTVNEEILEWVNKIMPEEDSSFRKRFAYALSRLSDDGWSRLEEFCSGFFPLIEEPKENTQTRKKSIDEMVEDYRRQLEAEEKGLEKSSALQEDA